MRYQFESVAQIRTNLILWNPYIIGLLELYITSHATCPVLMYEKQLIIAELWRAKRACGAPWVSKSTHPRKFGNHVTVHRPLPVRPHHRETNF